MARLPHVPGLDRLRGVAVVAVVAYHLGLLPGGFVGVDLFFVLSGYLVTSLLLAPGRFGHDTSEPRSTASVLRSFWAARARRLVPALLVLVPVVALAALAVGWPATRLDDLAVDALATLTWWGNWRLVVTDQSYWATSPSPFRHAWSLAIEEQFYVAWPLVVAATTAVARRVTTSPRRIVGAVATIATTAAAAWHLLVAHRVGDAGSSRVYLGTDTRLVAVLVGCALACSRWGLRLGGVEEHPSSAHAGDGADPVARGGRPGRPWGALVVGAAGAAVLAWATVSFDVADPAVYRRGGFLLVAGASAALVGAVRVLDRSGRAGRATPGPAAEVLGWLGTRSYGIYLWSWPTQVLAEHRWPDADPSIRAALVATTALVAAEASYRLVEDPIRRGRSWARTPRIRVPALSFGALVPVVVLALVWRGAEPPPPHERISTHASAEMANAARPPVADRTPHDAGRDGLRVLILGDSVAFTFGYYTADPDRLPAGIASIDSRAVIGCGVLAAPGWLYRDEQGRFVPPSGGDCAPQARGEAMGLAGRPDVVVMFPGAWEATSARSPSGDVVQPETRQMAQALRAELVQRARAARDAGAAFVLVGWTCPPDGTPAERRDPRYIAWVNGVVVDAVGDARSEGVDARYLDPAPELCVGGPAGTPSPTKLASMGGSNHVTDFAEGRRIWSDWLAPALVDLRIR